MRLLFAIDLHDYDPSGTVFRRPSVRGIIRAQNGTIAMVHSLKYDYYKLPGGGIDGGETHTQTLIREVLEETGLRVLPQSIRPYGLVRRIQKGKAEDVFIQENFYYFCETEPDAAVQTLDPYEADEQFTLEWVTPAHAIAQNSAVMADAQRDPARDVMLERENRLLQMLCDEYPAWFQHAPFIPEERKATIRVRQLAVLAAAAFLIVSLLLCAAAVGQIRDPGSGVLMSKQMTFWLHAVLFLISVAPVHILCAVALFLNRTAGRSDNPNTGTAAKVVSVLSIFASVGAAGMFLLDMFL